MEDKGAELRKAAADGDLEQLREILSQGDVDVNAMPSAKVSLFPDLCVRLRVRVCV